MVLFAAVILRYYFHMLGGFDILMLCGPLVVVKGDCTVNAFVKFPEAVDVKMDEVVVFNGSVQAFGFSVLVCKFAHAVAHVMFGCVLEECFVIILAAAV